MRGGYFRFKTKYLEPFPLPELNDESAEQLAQLAVSAGQATGSEADRKMLEQRIKLLDSQINAQVYALYGLSAEDIAAIEGK